MARRPEPTSFRSEAIRGPQKLTDAIRGHLKSLEDPAASPGACPGPSTVLPQNQGPQDQASLSLQIEDDKIKEEFERQGQPKRLI